MRWKLDMTERFGHQRRKLLPDYEFYGLYNVDETVDQDKDDSKRSSDSAKSNNMLNVRVFICIKKASFLQMIWWKKGIGKSKVEDTEFLDDDVDDVGADVLIETDDEDDGEEEDPVLISAQSSSSLGGESRYIEEMPQAEEDNTQNESFEVEQEDYFSGDEEAFHEQHHHYDS